MNIEIKKTLNDKSLNEQEKCDFIIESVMNHCISENNILSCYRILKRIDIELSGYQRGVIEIHAKEETIVKLRELVCLEIKITKLKIKNPSLLEVQEISRFRWGDSVNDLVELICALLVKLDNGQANVSALAKTLSYIFQVRITNVATLIEKIVERKTKKIRYLNKLRDDLITFIQQKAK